MSDLTPWMREFLTELPAHTGVLATVRPDGRPHSKPIWFALDVDTIVFNTGEDTVAGRNMAHDQRISLCIEVEKPPYTFVVLQGTVSLSTHDDDAAALSLWAGRLGARYLGADKEEAMAARNGVPGEYLVRMTIASATGAQSVSD